MRYFEGSLIMKNFAIFILFLLHSSACISQEENDFSYYKKLNDEENRLNEFKDSDEALKIKLKQLQVINASRKKFHAPGVKLDILASRVANQICKESADNKYLGHWNMAGEKPYHRYAFAGGKDHVTENAASYSLSGAVLKQSSEAILQNMKFLHNEFMAEKKPNDGHKQNCINPRHNFVGLGYYSGHHEFRYYEEFIDRYFEFENVPRQVKAGENFSFVVKPSEGNYLYYLAAYQEDFPKPMKPKAINRKNSYDDYSSNEAAAFTPWELSKMRSGEKYKIELKFDKPGLYYIHIYDHEKEIKERKSFSTEGKTAGSGIVVKVE